MNEPLEQRSPDAEFEVFTQNGGFQPKLFISSRESLRLIRASCSTCTQKANVIRSNFPWSAIAQLLDVGGWCFGALKSQTFSSLLRKVESFLEKSQNGNITYHWKSQTKRVPVAFPKLRLKKADAVSRAGILLFQAVQSVDDCDETEKPRNLHVSKIWPRAVISDHFVQWEILIQFHFRVMIYRQMSIDLHLDSF